MSFYQKIGIVYPAYNETKCLPSTLSSTFEHLTSYLKHSFEILIIDDGSSDGAATFALKLAAKKHSKADIRVMQLRRTVIVGSAGGGLLMRTHGRCGP